MRKVRIELTRGNALLNTPKIFEFEYADYIDFMQKFLKRFSNINSDIKLKESIRATKDFAELNQLFKHSDKWTMHIKSLSR